MFIHERFASCSRAEVKSCCEHREKWLLEYDRMLADGVAEDYPMIAASLRISAAYKRHEIKVLKRYERLMKKHKLAYVRDLVDVDEPVEEDDEAIKQRKSQTGRHSQPKASTAQAE